jgi:hypothetical protein
MTPLQNDPQQHQREAKRRKLRVSRGHDLSPDSDAARKTLQKSGLGSDSGPQKNDFSFGPGWGLHDGGTKVNTGPAESNSNIIENPLSLALLGETHDPRRGRSALLSGLRRPLSCETLRSRRGVAPQVLRNPSVRREGFVGGSGGGPLTSSRFLAAFGGGPGMQLHCFFVAIRATEKL